VTRRILLVVFVAVVVSAVAASATAVALGGRADLAASRRQVDTAWRALRPSLDGRYHALTDASALSRARLNAERAVFGDIVAAAAAWPGTASAPTDVQVAAAGRLEGLAARLSAAVAATPRLRSAPDVAAALGRVRDADPGAASESYNRTVADYERIRGGFPRRLVAAALGYDARRTLAVPNS